MPELGPRLADVIDRLSTCRRMLHMIRLAGEGMHNDDGEAFTEMADEIDGRLSDAAAELEELRPRALGALPAVGNAQT